MCILPESILQKQHQAAYEDKDICNIENRPMKDVSHMEMDKINDIKRSPIKGQVKRKNTPPLQKSPLFCLATTPASAQPRFSLSLRTRYFCLIGSGQTLARTSHPSGSRRIVLKFT